MEQALGLPEGFFDNGAVRVDIPLSGSEGLRIPSGNEAGASDQWIPGGNLPTGISEAVIDVGGLDSARYSLSTLSQMEGAK
jgi:filamentous hemagglutinin